MLTDTFCYLHKHLTLIYCIFVTFLHRKIFILHFISYHRRVKIKKQVEIGVNVLVSNKIDLLNDRRMVIFLNNNKHKILFLIALLYRSFRFSSKPMIPIVQKRHEIDKDQLRLVVV